MRDRRFHACDRSHHVNLETTPPGVLVHRHAKRADIGDEDVEPTEMLYRIGDPGAFGHVDDLAMCSHSLPGKRRYCLFDAGRAARIAPGRNLPLREARRPYGHTARPTGHDRLFSV